MQAAKAFTERTVIRHCDYFENKMYLTSDAVVGDIISGVHEVRGQGHDLVSRQSL